MCIHISPPFWTPPPYHPTWLSINSHFHNNLKNNFFSWIVQLSSVMTCCIWFIISLLKFWSWTLSNPLLFLILASLLDTSLEPLPALLTSWRIQAYFPLEMSHFLDLSDYFLLFLIFAFPVNVNYIYFRKKFFEQDCFRQHYLFHDASY